MKIGILTFHHSNYNYGAVLQAFSIYKLIETLGYESYIINYVPEPAGFRKKIAAQIVALLGLEFKKFRKNNIKRMLPKTSRFSELKKLNELLDGFVVGSDQVWRYRKDEQSMFRYYLDFADENKTKIAYAVSFGVDHWEADEKVTQKIKKLVDRFQAISVREESGVEICKNIFGVKSFPVLDPTLLLDPKFFHEMADKKPVAKTDKRKLVYMLLDDSEANENFFKATAKEHGLTFTRINGKKLVPKKGFYLYKSVNSWLNNIKHAEVVITDSFHCTVFAILFRKKFVCLTNKHRGITRLENLLKLIRLENRLVSSLTQIDKTLLKNKINYQFAEQVLANERNKSIHFLKSSLEKVKLA